MLRYFPFPSTFDLKMGTNALAADHPVVEMDEHYVTEVVLKRSLLKESNDYYFKAAPVSLPAQWEVLDKILTTLSLSHPQHFHYEKRSDQCSWENELLKEKIEFVLRDLASLPLAPLDWVGRQVQEDLLLLDAASILQAGQLCFPSGWDLGAKFQKHFLDLHAPVPSLMTPTLRAADKLIERIPIHKPIARTNWGFRMTEQMDLSSRHTQGYLKLLEEKASEITEENAGDKIFVRSERQTLSRLPSGFVLFTIHTYNSLLKDECTNVDRAKAMHSFLQTVPKELLEYKLVTTFVGKLVRYLEHVTLQGGKI